MTIQITLAKDNPYTFKVRPVIDHLLAILKEIYSPGQEITLDEQICPFRGRIGFRVYVKGKPHKYGLKLWMICDAVTGLPLTFEIYTGKNQDNAAANTVENLVQRVAAGFEGRGTFSYIIYGQVLLCTRNC